MLKIMELSVDINPSYQMTLQVNAEEKPCDEDDDKRRQQ